MERRSQKDPSVEEAAQVLSSLGYCYSLPADTTRPRSNLDLMKISRLVNLPNSPKQQSSATSSGAFSLRDISPRQIFNVNTDKCRYELPGIGENIQKSFSRRVNVLLPPLVIPKIESPTIMSICGESTVNLCSKKHCSPEKHKRFKTVTERIHLIKERYFSKDIDDDIPELDNIPRLLYQIRVDVRKGPKKVGTKDIQRHLWDVKLLALFERKLIHKLTGEILDPKFRDDVNEGRLVRWRDAQVRIKIAWRQTALYQPELRPRKKPMA